MTNILVPTDFTPASLKLAAQGIAAAGENNINVILFHAFELPSSAFDLLGSDYKEPAHELINEAFRQACRQLKNDFPKQIAKITVRCMNGNTNALFRNFIEANDIDLIYCSGNFIYKRIHERSVDPKNFFKKSGVPILREANKNKVPLFSNQRFITTAQPAARII